MSQKNVRLARQAFDAFNRRDWAAFLALMDADVEAVPRQAAMEGSFRGHDEVRRWLETLLDAIPDFTLDVLAVRDVADLTLARLRNRGHGGESDTPVEQTIWAVAQWRRGKCVWWRNFLDEAEALAAVGLSV